MNNQDDNGFVEIIPDYIEVFNEILPNDLPNELINILFFGQISFYKGVDILIESGAFLKNFILSLNHCTPAPAIKIDPSIA